MSRKEPTDMNRGELVAEVRKLRHLLARHLSGGENLWMESGVNEKGVGFVHLHWGQESGQLTTAEALDHARKMIETASAADFDAAFMRAMHQTGIEHEQAAMMLGLIRQARGGEQDASATAT